MNPCPCETQKDNYAENGCREILINSNGFLSVKFLLKICAPGARHSISPSPYAFGLLLFPIIALD